jgi:hypothetical protein
MCHTQTFGLKGLKGLKGLVWFGQIDGPKPLPWFGLRQIDGQRFGFWFGLARLMLKGLSTVWFERFNMLGSLRSN